MIKKILLALLAFNLMNGFSQGVKQDKMGITPTVYLIGAIHKMHFNSDNHYTVNDLMAQIRVLKPDLVCGEITPEAFNQSMEGYFPPEASCIAEMASELNYRFVPVDWRLDYATQFSIANNNFPDSIQKLRTALLNDLHAKIATLDSISLYDVIHQKTILKDLDSLYEKIIGPNPLAEIASGSWHERNRRIIENGLMAAENAHTIVFVFGLDHLPQLQRQLKTLGIEAQIPKRLFTPSKNYKVSKAVLNRWKRNVENLKLIRDKKIPITYDNYQKVINCKRIEDIEEAIQKSI
jgi:hypothetical protein